MNKPLALIIEPYKSMRKDLETKLASLGFCVQTLRNYEAWNNYKRSRGKRAQVYFLSYSLSPISGVKLAEEISTDYPLSAKVVMTHAHEEPELETMRNLLIDEWIDKPVANKDLYRILKKLRDSRKLTQDLTLGILGSGKIGKGVLKRAVKERWIREIHFFSRFITEEEKSDYSKIEAEIETPETGELSQRKIFYHKSLRSFVEAEPNVLLIATGKHYEAGKLPERKDMFGDNIKILDPIFRLLRDIKPNSLKIIETNPPGPVMQYARRVYRLDPYEMTSISPDPSRYKTTIIGILWRLHDLRLAAGTKPRENKGIEEFLKGLAQADVNVLVIGEHGESFSDLRKCSIRGRRLEDIDEEYFDGKIFNPNSDVKNWMTDLIRPLGKRATIALRESKDKDYINLPDDIMAALRDIADYQERARDQWYCYHENQGISLIWPTKLKLTKGRRPHLRVYPDYSELRISDLEQENRNALEKQIQEQIKLAGGNKLVSSGIS